MSLIETAFARCREQGRSAFIPFLMAGDPDAATTLQALAALADAGADIIELGIPFSDPMADGPVIAQAGQRALQAGMTLEATLTIAGEFRARFPLTPLVLMGYLNPIYRYGYARFAQAARAQGVDGVIIVDLPPEEAVNCVAALDAQAIAVIRLIAPTSVPARLALLTQGARGYLYYIAYAGITGGQSLPAEAAIAQNVAQIREHSDLPVAVGFGVKTPADVARLAPHADGLVVGSALVETLHAHGLAAFAALAKSLVAAGFRP